MRRSENIIHRTAKIIMEVDRIRDETLPEGFTESGSDGFDSELYDSQAEYERGEDNMEIFYK